MPGHRPPHHAAGKTWLDAGEQGQQVRKQAWHWEDCIPLPSVLVKARQPLVRRTCQGYAWPGGKWVNELCDDTTMVTVTLQADGICRLESGPADVFWELTNPPDDY